MLPPCLGTSPFMKQVRKVSDMAEKPKTTKLILDSFPTNLVPEKSVDFALILPPNFLEIKDPIPLVLNLHGGGGSRDDIIPVHEHGMFDQKFEDDDAQPYVTATISAGQSFYLDYFDKSQMWESFILNEFIPFLNTNFNCGGEKKSSIFDWH